MCGSHRRRNAAYLENISNFLRQRPRRLGCCWLLLAPCPRHNNPSSRSGSGQRMCQYCHHIVIIIIIIIHHHSDSLFCKHKSTETELSAVYISTCYHPHRGYPTCHLPGPGALVSEVLLNMMLLLYTIYNTCRTLDTDLMR